MSISSGKKFINRRNYGLRNGGICKDGYRAICTNRWKHLDLLTLPMDRVLDTQAIMKHPKLRPRCTYARLIQREFADLRAFDLLVMISCRIVDGQLR